MAQDIEEFLRMAAARKKQQQNQAGGGQQAPAQPPQQQQQYVQQQYNEPPPPPNLAPPALTPPANNPDVYILDESDIDPYDQHQTLQPSIHSSVSTADIVEHTSHLGERVHNRSDAVESRVSQKFDHDLGSLQKEELEAPEIVDHGKGLEHKPNISTVLNMIRNPNSLKQAIILKEIFDRPKF